MARTKLNSKKNLESFSSLPSILGRLRKSDSLRSRRLEVVGERENCAHYFQAPAAQARKATKNTAERVIMKKIFIYAGACVNKDFVHSGSTGVISRASTRAML